MIHNLHIRQETEKGENIWSGRAVMNGEFKWLSIVMPKDVSEQEIRMLMERLTKVNNDPRKRAV